MIQLTAAKYPLEMPLFKQPHDRRTRSAPRLRLWLCILVTTLTASQVQADDELATDFATSLNAIISAVRTPDTSASALAPHIDFAAITRGVLGKNRNALNEQQTERFQGEFETSMITLLRTATQATGEFDIEVTQTRISEKNNARGQAYADVVPQNGKKIPIIASVAKGAGGWKVRNLIFDGVNLGLTYRNQFDQLLQTHNGDVDLTIDAWAANTVSKAP